MKPAGRLALVLLLALLAACGDNSVKGPSMAVGASPDPQSQLLANVYAAALRSYGTPAHVETLSDPLAGLDSGQVSVVPGLTGQLLHGFAPGSSDTSDEKVYKAMVGTLPEGVSVGDYTTAAEDKPAVALTETTAAAWGGRDLTTLVNHCAELTVGAVKGARTPARVGKCTLPAPREFPDDAALFNALRAKQINAAWTTTADPGVPGDVLVLTDAKPALIQAENVVPLYRRNELTARQVLAVNEVAGVLDTAALKRMRQQVAEGTDPQAAAEGWLADNPLGR
ncbi:glycine betaine ABC transporter substrate-binding protein [Mycolicibacterium komossense]